MILKHLRKSYRSPTNSFFSFISLLQFPFPLPFPKRETTLKKNIEQRGREGKTHRTVRGNRGKFHPGPLQTRGTKKNVNQSNGKNEVEGKEE
jgi:hypothetical protein